MPGNENVALSILIPTFNRADTLDRALATVFSQTLDSFEVIVVDNGPSTDRTPAVIEEYECDQLQYVRTEEQGCIVARNMAAERASGTYLLTIDDDIELLETTTLERLVDIFRANNGVGVIGSIELPDPEYEVQSSDDAIDVGRITNGGDVKTAFETLDGHGITSVDHVRSAFMGIRRDVFTSIGGFDQSYHARGLGFRYETDLCMRVQQAGYDVVVDPEIKIWHKGAARSRGFERNDDAEYYYFASRNHAVFMNRFFWHGQLRHLLNDLIFGSYRVPGVARIVRRAIRHRDVGHLAYTVPATAGKLNGFLRYLRQE